MYRRRRYPRLRLLSLIAALCSSPSAAFGVSFSAPLRGLIGTLPTGYDFRESSFDIGQHFSEIENVWIEVEAKVSALEFDVCGTFYYPQPCVHEVHLLGFFARLDKEDSPAFGTVFSEGLSFSDDSHALEGYGVDTEVFNNPLVGWNFLLDGEGSLVLYWNSTAGDPDRIIQNVIQPSGEILNARLIIEGTPIPEPSTALLVAAGLFLLAGTQRNPPTLR